MLERELRRKVIDKVKCAGIYSVMADTTPDEEHTDRLLVVLRYISSTGQPTERLLDLSKTEEKTGLGQAQGILSSLRRCGLNILITCVVSRTTLPLQCLENLKVHKRICLRYLDAIFLIYHVKHIAANRN